MENQMGRRYELDTALFRLERKMEAVAKSVREEKYTLRQAKQEQILYDGSFRSFLHKLSGKQEEKKDALRRAVSTAQAELDFLTREQEMLEASREAIEKDIAILPSSEEIKQWASADPETKKQWAALEAAFCAEQLQTLLEKTDEALEAYRAQLRGDRMGEIVSYEELHEIGTAHVGLANACRPLLQGLREALQIRGQSLETGSYFENPAGYIVSAAAQHNRIDRVNEALSQVAAARRQIAAVLSAEE